MLKNLFTSSAACVVCYVISTILVKN